MLISLLALLLFAQDPEPAEPEASLKVPIRKLMTASEDAHVIMDNSGGARPFNAVVELRLPGTAVKDTTAAVYLADGTNLCSFTKTVDSEIQVSKACSFTIPAGKKGLFDCNAADSSQAAKDSMCEIDGEGEF